MRIDTSIKGWAESAVYVIVGFYAWLNSTGVNAYVFSVLAFFMALDMSLGWVKAKRVHELEDPTSKKAKKGILTKLVMLVLPVVVGLIWGAFDDHESAFKVVNVLLTGLMVAEGYSCIANAHAVRTGELLSEFDAVTFVFKKTAEKIRNLLEELMGESMSRNKKK